VSKAWAVLKMLSLRLRFVLAFAAIALVVASWPWVVNGVRRWTGGASAAVAHSPYEWYCPMCPSVVRDDGRDKCPACHMALAKRRKEPAGPLAEGLQLSPRRIHLAGVATEEIRVRPLVREIRTAGQVGWDERRFTRLGARAAGRVEELYAGFVGARVKKGDPLCKLSSVAAQGAMRLYVESLRRREAARSPAGPAEDRSILEIASARERVRALGLTEEQIAELERIRQAPPYWTIHSPASGVVVKKDIVVGQSVQSGEDLYTIADDSGVWVQAHVFERDLGLVREGQPVEITAEAYRGRTFPGRVAYILPILETRTRTAKVRVEIPNPEGRLKIGMSVTAVLRVLLDAEKSPAVPCSAVVDAGVRKVVFVERAPGVFEGVAVEVGPRGLAPGASGAAEYYPVLKGVSVGDRVVVAGAFLLDAEAQLTRTSALYFGADGHKVER